MVCGHANSYIHWTVELTYCTWHTLDFVVKNKEMVHKYSSFILDRYLMFMTSEQRKKKNSSNLVCN